MTLPVSKDVVLNYHVSSAPDHFAPRLLYSYAGTYNPSAD